MTPIGPGFSMSTREGKSKKCHYAMFLGASRPILAKNWLKFDDFDFCFCGRSKKPTPQAGKSHRNRVGAFSGHCLEAKKRI